MCVCGHAQLEQLFCSDTNHPPPPPPPSSAAMGPGSCDCDVFNLYNVHLHAEAVSNPYVRRHRACSSCIFPSFSSGLSSRIKQKICPPVPTPVIPDFTNYRAHSQVTDSHRFPFSSGHHKTVFLNVALTDVLYRRRCWKGRRWWTI